MRIPLSDYRAINKINQIAANCHPQAEIEYCDGIVESYPLPCETLTPALTDAPAPKRPKRKNTRTKK
jgi:hypothetical protein